MRVLSLCNPPSGAVATVTVTSVTRAAVQIKVHVLFHCQDLFVRSVRKWYSFLFSLCQSFSVEAPYVLYALQLKLVCLA